MQRVAAAIETIERVIGMSRAAGLFSIERNALEKLANLYDKSGRAKDAEVSRARAKELWAIRDPPTYAEPPVVKPPRIPVQWVDLLKHRSRLNIASSME